jgi:diguanylate cyclase (GGDEF)-like protein
MSNFKKVLVISKDKELNELIKKILKDFYEVFFFQDIYTSLNYIYSSLPDIMVIELDIKDNKAISLLNNLKSDPIFGRLPVLAILDNDFDINSWDTLMIDDYIRISCIDKNLLARINLGIQRVERLFEVNPLTRLPGNIAIIKQIQKRLDDGEIFGLAYLDLDNFKPFNDKYGFVRGDEVLKMLGRLILNTVRQKQPHRSFVGHIGGDDFVFIMDVPIIEDTAKEIIDNFNKIIPTFYDIDDRLRGSIESVNRQGKKRNYPFISVSIGITSNESRQFSHYGEMAEVASEMKSYAKQCGGNCFYRDRRQQQKISA